MLLLGHQTVIIRTQNIRQDKTDGTLMFQGGEENHEVMTDDYFVMDDCSVLQARAAGNRLKG